MNNEFATYYVAKYTVVKHREGFDIHHNMLARGFKCYCLPANPIDAFNYLIDPPHEMPVDHRQAIGNYILNPSSGAPQWNTE